MCVQGVFVAQKVVYAFLQACSGTCSSILHIDAAAFVVLIHQIPQHNMMEYRDMNSIMKPE